MNKILGATVLVILLFAGFYYFYNRSYESTAPIEESIESEDVSDDTTNADSTTQTDKEKLLNSATVTVPDTENYVPGGLKVTLTDEVTEFGEEKNLNGSVYVTDYVEEMDNGNMVAVIAFNYGGSGQFYYLVGFEPGEATYVMTDMVLLGDRIVMEDFLVEGEKVTVSYKEHGKNQTMAEEPNVSVTKTFTYTNGNFTEVE